MYALCDKELSLLNVLTCSLITVYEHPDKWVLLLDYLPRQLHMALFQQASEEKVWSAAAAVIIFCNIKFTVRKTLKKKGFLEKAVGIEQFGKFKRL